METQRHHVSLLQALPSSLLLARQQQPNMRGLAAYGRTMADAADHIHVLNMHVRDLEAKLNQANTNIGALQLYMAAERAYGNPVTVEIVHDGFGATATATATATGELMGVNGNAHMNTETELKAELMRKEEETQALRVRVRELEGTVQWLEMEGREKDQAIQEVNETIGEANRVLWTEKHKTEAAEKAKAATKEGGKQKDAAIKAAQQAMAETNQILLGEVQKREVAEQAKAEASQKLSEERGRRKAAEKATAEVNRVLAQERLRREVVEGEKKSAIKKSREANEALEEEIRKRMVAERERADVLQMLLEERKKAEADAMVNGGSGSGKENPQGNGKRKGWTNTDGMVSDRVHLRRIF